MERKERIMKAMEKRVRDFKYALKLDYKQVKDMEEDEIEWLKEQGYEIEDETDEFAFLEWFHQYILGYGVDTRRYAHILVLRSGEGTEYFLFPGDGVIEYHYQDSQGEEVIEPWAEDYEIMREIGSRIWLVP